MNTSARMDKTVTVYSSDVSYHNGPPDNLMELIEWLKGWAKEIPDEYMASSDVDIEAGMDYDIPYAEISITYTRPETDDEMDTRLNNWKTQADKTKQKELELLASLKIKYREIK